MGAGFPLDAIAIESASAEPLVRQLCNELRRAILAGRIAGGTRLPASRAAASDLGLGRNTVIAAYEALVAEGLLEARIGAGTFVSDLHLPRRTTERGGMAPGLPSLSRRGRAICGGFGLPQAAELISFHPGYPDLRQFPFRLWSRLVADNQRLKLLEIARESDCWIVQDDYDSEYRFRGRPMPALHGLDGSGRVLYVGTFAKTVFPSLRIGFIVVPAVLAGDFGRAVAAGQHPPVLLQLALADFMRKGHFAGHLRRMRALYAGHRRILEEECRRVLADHVTFDAAEAGIQLTLYLRPGVDDAQLLEHCGRRRLHCTRLSLLCRTTPPRQSLILG